MIEMEDQQLPISSVAPIIDEESVSEAPSAELHHKNHIKYAIYIAALIVFHIIVLVIVEQTIMRVRTPNYCINVLTVDSLTVSNSTNPSPSFNIYFVAEITIKNRNFGPYKFYNNFNHVDFLYGKTRVGWGILSEGSAKIRSTKRLDLKLNVSSVGVPSNSNLGKDLDMGILRFSSKGEMRGQVELLKFIKKDKNVKMNCDLAVNLVDKVVQDLVCD